MDAKLKHLEFIQGVINRLATNSFRMKGWAVVLVAALLVLLAREEQVEFALIVLIPVVLLWVLDGYYLWQERRFVDLYDDVRKLDEEDIDFAMDASEVSSKTLWGAVFSVTLLLFYFAMALSIVVIALIS